MNGATAIYGAMILAGFSFAEEKGNVHDLPSDLRVPEVEIRAPEAGKRVWQSLPDYETWKVRHALYLPTDWEPKSKGNGKYPVIIEYPGNGDFKNQLGDKSQGRVEDCKMGYGISGGKKFIWVSMPFVDPKTKAHATHWWGDADLTASYCRATVAQVCQDFGGDSERVVLCGFSRGAIACGYIGLRDDATAKLWRAMIIHSHYDGVRRWGFPDDDEKSAKVRLSRFAGRPQFITQENSVDAIQTYLQGTKVLATLRKLPFPNHTDEWLLKDIPLRAELRNWLDEVLR